MGVVHSKLQLLRIVSLMMDLLGILRFFLLFILPLVNQPLTYYVLMVTHLLLPQTQSPGFESEFESDHPNGAEGDRSKSSSYKTSGFSPAFYRQVHMNAL